MAGPVDVLADEAAAWLADIEPAFAGLLSLVGQIERAALAADRNALAAVSAAIDDAQAALVGLED